MLLISFLVNYKNTDPCIWPMFPVSHVQGNSYSATCGICLKKTLKLEPPSVVTKEKIKEAIFSLKTCPTCLSFLFCNPSWAYCYTSKLVSTGMQSRFSNIVAKSLHKNQCINCTRMENDKSEAQISERQTTTNYYLGHRERTLNCLTDLYI